MKKILFLGVFLWLAVSCAPKPKEVPVGPLPSPQVSGEEVQPPASPPPAKGDEKRTRAVAPPPSFKEETLAAAEARAASMPLEERWKLYGRSTPPLKAIFFDFDDYRIRRDMLPRLREDARFLLEHPEYRVELQGNCDERGDRDYNLALGEKRALEVRRFLINLGVSPERLSTVSFGEERPLAPGHDEASWAINRRVDLVIVNKNP
ncbi:OmpA family protein [Thermosulfurimonas sp. F29]|uniref:peptidoglycan-associated lipoprotein n=1 Tax=Thermosulfurimonas sp. F29 TaxID=2867247 RepID=UPI001C828F5D|nr:OmpA family protein [Thermosulfurimonas sp. F29]MBX6423863.1 OmpA family protein [Thermosulfurimonas sp. F29]